MKAVEGLTLAKSFFVQIRIQGTTVGLPQNSSGMLACVCANHLRPVGELVYPFVTAVAALERVQKTEQLGKLVLCTLRGLPLSRHQSSRLLIAWPRWPARRGCRDRRPLCIMAAGVSPGVLP